jgi:hypothetical protein
VDARCGKKAVELLADELEGQVGERGKNEEDERLVCLFKGESFSALMQTQSGLQLLLGAQLVRPH